MVLVLGLGIPVFTVPAATGLPGEPFKLFVTYVVLLGASLLVTRVADGPGAVRRLLARILAWRFGVGRWAVILLGMPVLTYGLAVVSGTFERPDSGWLTVVGLYLFNTLVFGTLLLNLWEETAWGGFAQSRLTARHGLLVGAVITAVPFAAIHLPLYLANGWTSSELAVSIAVLLGLAPVYRYLLGMHLLDTGGSVLAVGLQHSAWNASTDLDGVRGEWQSLAAVVLLTVLVAVSRRLWHPETHALGVEAEEAEAASWGPWADRSREPGGRRRG